MADKPTFEDYMNAGEVPLPAAIQQQQRSGATFTAPALLPPAECGGEHDAPQEYRGNGISIKMLQKLQRSAPQGTLDLHGLTVAEAHLQLETFLHRAQRSGWRIVEVIHGRGLHGGGGILRNKTRYWLAHCDEVLAHCSPAKNNGALLALLRQRRHG